MAPTNPPNRYPYQPPTFDPTPEYGADDSTGTSWRPTRKFLAGLIIALVYFVYDVVSAGELSRAHLDTVVPQLGVLAAFYLTSDR